MKQNRKSNKIKITIAAIIVIAIVLLGIQFVQKRNTINKVEIAKSGQDVNIAGTTISSTVLTNVPNTPQIAAGMIPVKYNSDAGLWQITTVTDADWYNYETGKFATVMLSDGYYKSELQVGIDAEKQLSEKHIGASILAEQLGTIYVWVPRLVYTTNGFEYLKEIGIVESKEYTMSSCFTYKQKKQPELALFGVWVERTPQETKTETDTKISEMNTEENPHGLIRSEVVQQLSGVANKVVKTIQEGKGANEQQVQNTDSLNRTMIRVVNTNRRTPIIVTTQVANQTAYIKVTYHENDIVKIISLDTGELLSTINPTMSVPENGTYQFAVIDEVGNIRVATARVGTGIPDLVGFKVNTTYLVAYSIETDEETGTETTTEYSTLPIESILKEGYEVDKNNALVKGAIDSKKVADELNKMGENVVWYDYEAQKWANIVTRNNANEIYYTWIPRYVYKLNQTDQTSEVVFVSTENTDPVGAEMDLEEWSLPEAFTWEDSNGEEIPLSGFWVSKYALTDAVTMGLNANVVGGINKIRVNNITNTSGLANITYDLYLYEAGVDRTKVVKGDELQFIQNTTYHIFEDLPIGDYEIRIVINDSTGKYRGEEWFEATVIQTAQKPAAPDLTGFRTNTTYIVTYTNPEDQATMDASIPISEILTDNYTVDSNQNTLVTGVVDENKVTSLLNGTGATWYDYNTQKWANVVTRNAGSEIYYTWIPRYVYKLDTVDQSSEIQFVGTDIYGDKIPEGWSLPEAFTWTEEDGTEKQLSGYWVTKYALTDKTNFKITADIVPGTNKIRISSVQDGSGLGLTYRFYLYEAKAETKEFFAEPEAEMRLEDITNDHDCTGKNYVRYSEGLTEVIYYGLTAQKYDLRIVAYDSRGYYRGEEWFNDIEVIDIGYAAAPDLTGFNPDVTYYVTYNSEGKEDSSIKISNPAPDGWYDYTTQKWANIVTKNNGKTVYLVWIPRYVYMLDSVRQSSEIQFVGTDVYGDKVPEGWSLPEAFTWGNEENPDERRQLSGYWVSKYALSE